MDPKLDKFENLLRFNSRGLAVETKVQRLNGDTYIVLSREDIELGRRRLNKRKCCSSDSPCIGPIEISPEHRKQFGLPAFINISICFDEIEEFAARSDSDSQPDAQSN